MNNNKASQIGNYLFFALIVIVVVCGFLTLGASDSIPTLIATFIGAGAAAWVVYQLQVRREQNQFYEQYVTDVNVAISLVRLDLQEAESLYKTFHKKLGQLNKLREALDIDSKGISKKKGCINDKEIIKLCKSDPPNVTQIPKNRLDFKVEHYWETSAKYAVKASDTLLSASRIRKYLSEATYAIATTNEIVQELRNKGVIYMADFIKLAGVTYQISEVPETYATHDVIYYQSCSAVVENLHRAIEECSEYQKYLSNDAKDILPVTWQNKIIQIEALEKS